MPEKLQESNSQVHPLDVHALEQALLAADRGVLLVPARILRRVIKSDTRVARFGLRVPHRKTYVINRTELLTIAAAEELGIPSGRELPETIILIARPSTDWVATSPAQQVLTKYWRLLFHARVHLALDQQTLLGTLTADAALRLRRAIGETAYAEAMNVLRLEDMVLPPESDVSLFIEFAAVYLELRCFAAKLVKVYFPGLLNEERVDELLDDYVDAKALLEQTRIADAELTIEIPDRPDLAQAPELASETNQDQPSDAPILQMSLARRAQHARAAGNLVRAAILETAATRIAPPLIAAELRRQARIDLDALVKRLAAALDLSDAEAEAWSRALLPLLSYSSRGNWTAEARLLYDLQKVCVDHERGVYSLNLWRWVRSLGRAPLKRWLPAQRDVLISKHLRSAWQRTAAVRVAPRVQARLAKLLETVVHRAEQALRTRFRPQIDTALDAVNLTPRNLPERVARQKLVDELLDRIVERGFLTMGDLRDALSRNALKLPDLSSVRQLLFGDQLLRADRRLGNSMQGVYHRGEIYLRLPQVLSSLAFGTPLGRLLTKYGAIPFGGAYLILEGLQHILHPIGSHLGRHVPEMNGWRWVFSLGIVLLGLIHLPKLRSMVWSALSMLATAVRVVLIDVPVKVLALPAIQAIVNSPVFRLTRRYLLKPLVVWGVILTLAQGLSGDALTVRDIVFLFVIVNLVLNSRFGRSVDEALTDWTVHTWHRFRVRIIASLFRLIIDVFNRILENIERLLYTVDEWLRFRAGERRAATATKLVLGFFWIFIAYLIRFCVTLLIEPQINPIKHFPVVTVSHKLLVWLIVPPNKPLVYWLEPVLGLAWAEVVAPIIVFSVPGIFGFLVWELKENWRLYQANRPKNLKPLLIGSHGETVLQVLKRGFRSGTLPKNYAKLRRAYRKAQWTGNWRAVARVNRHLEHVEQDIRRFVGRELVALLRMSCGWGRADIRTGKILLSTNQILVELDCPDLSAAGLWLALREQAGWLVASIDRPGWLDQVSRSQRHTFSDALAGFYKMAGVDLVEEQIVARLDRSGKYVVNDEGLLVWNRITAEKPVLIRIDQVTADGQQVPSTASFRGAELVFAATPISWRRWVIIWEVDQLPHRSHHTIDDLRLLPELRQAS